MPEDTSPAQWTGRQAVVTLPEDIDSSNAGKVRERLLWVINRGAGGGSLLIRHGKWPNPGSSGRDLIRSLKAARCQAQTAPDDGN